MFSDQGNIAGGKERNYKGRKNPKLIQKYYFLTIYGKPNHFFKKPGDHCAQRKIILEKHDRIWTFILLDPMDLSFFPNEVLWEFQRPDLVCGANCFPVGHNLEPYSDRNLFPVEFCLGAELWFGVSSAWSCRFFCSQGSVDILCRCSPC